MKRATVQLGDFLTLKRGYDLPEHARLPGEIPVISSSGVTGTHKEAKVYGPGVVTGRYGTLGEVFYIDEPFWPLNTALYVQDFKGNHRRFVSYFLRWVLNGTQSDKAAVPGVNRNDLHARKVQVPDDLSEQAEIASVLSAYDDLIENNRRRIQLLEQAARLLYKEWFVHLRFPGHEHTRIIDGVPEGWERQSLGEFATILKGKNITKETIEEGDVPVVAGGLKPAYYHNAANASGPVITVSASGANAGHVALYHQDVWASDCSYLSSSDNSEIWFLYLSMKYCQAEITGMQQGAAQPHVYPKHLKRLGLLLPPRNLRDLFKETVEVCFLQIANLEKQTEKLAKARDLLLPKLMNGEMVV